MCRLSKTMLIALIGFTVSAQTVNLSGKVSNKNGAAVPGAIVNLMGMNLKDTTDATGAYSFMNTSAGTNRPGGLRIEKIRLAGAVVVFNLAESCPVGIEMFDMKGNLLERFLDRAAPAGAYKFDMTSRRFAAGVMLIRVSAGVDAAIFRYVPISGGKPSFARMTVTSGIARLQAAVDSLSVTATGYLSTTKAITSFETQVNINLDSLKLAKFSFFATSLAGLQRLSKNTNGFGGDLRFGKTGQGAGLLGADSICKCLAEASMPGSGAKQWRAFLSVNKDETGKPVNAIDRIGKGPWYDRLERPVSNSVADLQHLRPKADEDIINDLPNEDGVPNHRPDPNKPAVDNHQFITGSDTLGRLYSAKATCQDWTSDTDTASKPRCGLSYPRKGVAMGIGSDPWTEWNGDMTSWISVWNLWGCKVGTDLSEASIRGVKGTYTIGNGGGYGGFYCFALVP